MDDKKYPGRFTIAFNLNDERQRAASEELRRHGRRKARFLADAILYYSQGQGTQAGVGAPVDDILDGANVTLKGNTGRIAEPGVGALASVPLAHRMLRLTFDHAVKARLLHNRHAADLSDVGGIPMSDDLDPRLLPKNIQELA